MKRRLVAPRDEAAARAALQELEEAKTTALLELGNRREAAMQAHRHAIEDAHRQAHLDILGARSAAECYEAVSGFAATAKRFSTAPARAVQA